MFALLSVFASIGTVHAATISQSSSAPAVNDEDVASFGAQTGTDKWRNDNAASGAAKGQTFRTRNEALRLKAITYRVTTSVPATKVYTIRVGKISGTSFTSVDSQSATQTVAFAANNYVTWQFPTPLVLQPLTVGIGTNWVEAASSSVSSTNFMIDPAQASVFYRLVYP